MVGTRTYGGQGWGLCRLDGATLVQSDGSATLTLRNLDSFQKLSKVEVTLDGRPVDQLNELECVNGTVWANVWRTDRIVAVEVPSGRVTAVVDASDLVADRSGFGSDDVLNGIAHDPEAGRFLLTGKRRPVLFEVVFEPIPSSCPPGGPKSGIGREPDQANRASISSSFQNPASGRSGDTSA